MKYLTFTTYLAKLLVLSGPLLLAACGDSSDTSDTSNLPEASTPQVELSASNLKRVKLSALSRPINNGSTMAAGVLDSSGEIRYPEANEEVSGNVTISFEASDADGISKVYLGIAESDQAIIVCENECGTDFFAMVNGISPTLFGGISGEV
jgi:hypothetical protein